MSTAREQAREAAHEIAQQTGTNWQDAANAASDVWEPLLEQIRNVIVNESEVDDVGAFVRILKICKKALG